MPTCTFFGHRDTPDSIRPLLRETLRELITVHGADRFYVGNEGNFDRMAASVLRELREEFPHIRFAVVLAYLPQKGEAPPDSVYPEGLETVPKRFAISHRNLWMLKQADHVITYVTHPSGGAAQFAARAAKQGRSVCNLASPL